MYQRDEIELIKITIKYMHLLIFTVWEKSIFQQDSNWIIWQVGITLGFVNKSKLLKPILEGLSTNSSFVKKISRPHFLGSSK